MTTAVNRGGEFRRGWKALLASSVGVGCGLTAVPFYTFGIFVLPLQNEFGWSRGEIQLAITFYSIALILVSPLVGRLLDAQGARKVGLASMAIFATLFSCLAFVASSVWSLYLMWVVIAILSAGSTAITYTRAVSTWFDRRRGIALGLMLAGTGLTATLMPLYVTWLIETVGWRWTYPSVGATIFLIAFPVLFFFLKDPNRVQVREAELQMASSAEDIIENIGSGMDGVSLRDAVKSYRYWIIALGLFFVSFSVSGIIPNLVPMLTDKGFSATDAAEFAALIGVMVVSGRFLAGFLLDYLWAPVVAFVFLVPTTLTCLLLIMDSMSPAGVTLAVALLGLAAGAEYDLLAYLVGRYFGMKHYGVIYGTQFVFFGFAAAIGPTVFGYTYDITGSYDAVLYVTAALMIAAPSVLLTLRIPPAAFDRPQT